MPNRTVVTSLGFDIPKLPADLNTTSWWTPQEHAVHLHHSGLHVPLLSIPPDWLATLNPKYTKRDIHVGSIDNLSWAPPRAWFKPATMKHVDFPAAHTTRAAVEQFTDTQAGQHPARHVNGMWMQASQPVDWEWEVRCWIRHRSIETASLYLDHGHTWDETFTRDDRRTRDAATWCQQLLNDPNVHVPPGIVVDVGWSPTTGFSVIEANPAWASSWYSSDAEQVARVLDVSVDWAGEHKRWAYVPDPVLDRRYSYRPALPRR